MADQFGRKAQLVVGDGVTFLDVSQLRFRFQTTNNDTETPNTLYVRLYNANKQTASKIGAEFKEVILQAGYENGNFGVIFQGTIKQVETGKENNVDSYVDLWAADGDIWYNGAVINKTLAAGATPHDVIKAIVGTEAYDEQTTETTIAGGRQVKFSTDAEGLIVGSAQAVKNTLSRGKVMAGMARDYARDWANKNGFRWSIQNGEFTVVPVSGYRPGEAVVLTSSTGLIGVPVATEGGVLVRALLNSKIRIGCLVQIAQSDISHITMQQQGLSYSNAYSAAAAPTTATGFYRVMQAEFSGDTRGQEWYVDMICLAVDVSAPADASVAIAG